MSKSGFSETQIEESTRTRTPLRRASDERRASSSSWRPTLGAWPEGDGVRVRVWAPEHDRVELVWRRDGDHEVAAVLSRYPDGTHGGWFDGLTVGLQYRYRLPDGRVLPDPASRFQPEGVHGPSAVIDPSAFEWTDDGWTGVSLADAVIYELHVGAFTEQGTFAGVEDRLAHLAALGVTAIELMPIAEFAGRWNWGYDGVDLFAPSHHYGTPDDLRRLVNAAHRTGLAVILDVVYNHLGPDGAYLSAFSPYYFTNEHHTPWGSAVNLNGAHAERVREFFLQNALHWIHDTMSTACGSTRPTNSTTWATIPFSPSSRRPYTTRRR